MTNLVYEMLLPGKQPDEQKGLKELDDFLVMF